MKQYFTYRWKSYWRILFVFMLLANLSSIKLVAQGHKQMTRILFMLDGSQSMANNWVNGSKMSAAKRILTNLVDSLAGIDNLQMALRVYGHQSYYSIHDCRDSKLEVGFRSKNEIFIKSKLRTIQPKGITPIAYSLERSEHDFPSDDNSRNIIILITDGEESCDGDPCAVANALQKKRAIVRPFVIGLNVQSNLNTRLDCIGTYYDASSPDNFESILHAIIKNVLNQTTTQVNLLDIDGQATESDINMTFYIPLSNSVGYNYYHTITDRGYSDSLEIDPLQRYNLIIQSLPPVELNNIDLIPNVHNVIEVPTPQGELNILMQSDLLSSYQSQIKCLIRKHEAPGTVNVQLINTTEKYIVGNYDIDILTLPRIHIEDVELKQSHTTSITLPNPGLVTFYSSIEIYGGVFSFKDNQLNKIYQLNNRILKETLALQPGTYYVIYRSRLAKDMQSTISKKFTINSGESKTIKL